MKFGYARVSTTEQNIELQIDALNEAGCEEIYIDKVSGSQKSRPQLDLLKLKLRKGDTLTVYRLDRLGRSLIDLVQWVNEMKDMGVHFESLQEKIDTSSPTGNLVFHIFASFAQFEKDLIKERTVAGLAAARARGRLGGRKKKLSSEDESILKDLYNTKKHTINSLCERFSISRRTLYRVVQEEVATTVAVAT